MTHLILFVIIHTMPFHFLLSSFIYSSIYFISFIFIYTLRRYVRLNRDRLKGASGELEALLGLNVLFEVLMTMSQIMSPFTPFFAEYLYQNLRKLQPLYGNTDKSVADDLTGKLETDFIV